jgi:uncharacterized membrane protein YphA (DoxX/SURF4 family)
MPTNSLPARATRKTSVALWVIQGVLAALFLFAGAMKLVTPVDKLAEMSALPVAFMQFIGCAEVLGALGLILPGLLRIKQVLTPLAASGLAIIMSGAVVATLETGPAAGALVPLIVGALLAFVFHGRSASFRHPITR